MESICPSDPPKTETHKCIGLKIGPSSTKTYTGKYCDLKGATCVRKVMHMHQSLQDNGPTQQIQHQVGVIFVYLEIFQPSQLILKVVQMATKKQVENSSHQNT